MTDHDAMKKRVRESYDRLGRRYSAWAGATHDPWREHFAVHLLQALPAGSRIADLGCGDGTMLTGQLAKRYRVTGVDFSFGQLRNAARSISNAEFICADIAALAFPPATFDGITAFYCLTHLPPADVPNVIQSVAKWLKPEGIFVASFGSQATSGSVYEDWLGVPMYFSGFDPPCNRRMAERSGLVIEQDRLVANEEFGREVIFHWIVARKAPSG